MAKRDGMSTGAFLLWMPIPFIMAAVVYVVACVPLVPFPLADGVEPDPDVIRPNVSLFHYLQLRLHPPGPLVGAT